MEKKTRVNRHGDRGNYDRETINRILDEGLVCHVAFNDMGQPFNVPMLYVRDGSSIILHASSKSRIYGTLSSGTDLCATVTIMDGIVLAKSAFNSSMNYRSVMIFGNAKPILDTREKIDATRLITEKAVKGRWDDCRQPDSAELKATGFLRIPIVQFSSKVREGPPVEGSLDTDLNYWSGVIPVVQTREKPVTAEPDSGKIQVPEYLKKEPGKA